MRINKLFSRLKNKSKTFVFGGILFFMFFFLFVFSAMNGLRTFTLHYPAISGLFFQQKNYLVIFQNNMELRPSGGFVSSFAKIRFVAGIPMEIKFEDVYGEIDDHEYFEPPYPMAKLLENEWYRGYSFRDANFFGDFKRSSEELLKMYRITRLNERIDGVIAVNFNALSDIVRIISPINIQGKTVSDKNLFEYLTLSVNDVDRHNVKSLENRKSVLSLIGEKAFKKTISNPFYWRGISESIHQSLQKKDIQLYFTNENLQKSFSKKGWTGVWKEKNLKRAFLAVVEANLGGMKSNRYISRNYTYSLKITDENLKGKGEINATFDLKMRHFGIENIPFSGGYRSYLRIYIDPEEINPADEIIYLEPGEEINIKKNFNLDPQILLNETFSIDIIKQSGTRDFVTVAVELPQGMTLESDSFEIKENIAFFNGFLDKDITLDMKILPDTNPPLLIKQINSELNRIELIFNENLHKDFSSDPFSYEVFDLDVITPEKTDEIDIKRIESGSRHVILHLTGQSVQPEERYGVRIKSIRDERGNVLPERIFTVVQRLK